MKNIISKFRIFALSAFSLTVVTNASAQGTMLGLGNENENTLSLTERILKLEKKHDAISIYFNTHVALEERIDGPDKGASFVGKQLRFEMLGTLNKHWSYRFRYRLNRPGYQQSDNFSNNIDMMVIRYKFNDKFDLSAGKLGCALGGYQYDDNPIQVLQFCDWLTGIDGFHLGVHGCYNVTKNHTLILGIYNTDNDRVVDYYSAAPFIKPSHFPVAPTLCWSGSFFGGKLQTLWSYTLMSEVKKNFGHLLMTGTKLNFKKWQLILDYYGAWEDVDHHQILSADLSNVLSKTASEIAGYPVEINVLARNTQYHTLMLDGFYQPTPHWNLTAGVRYERASSSNGLATILGNRINYGYQVAIQWIPDLTQDARISLSYIGRTTQYDHPALENYNRNRIELGLIYRIKAY